MKLTARLGAVSAVSLLAACGGGSSPTYNAMFSDYNSLEAASDAAAFVAPNAIPQDGRVTYNGVLFYNLRENGNVNEQDTILGTISIATNFDSSTFMGSATNFRDRDENSYDGVLTLDGGQITRTPGAPVTLNSSIGGTLTNGPVGTMTVGASFVGNFKGPDAQFIVGNLENGQVSYADGPTQLTINNSGVVAER